MITLDDIRAQLMVPSEFHGSAYEYAVPLVDAIEEKAKGDTYYAAEVEEWLQHGGTVVLRDTICDCFRNADFVMAEQGTILEGKHPYAFNDMWMAVDTARYLIGMRGERPCDADPAE